MPRIKTIFQYDAERLKSPVLNIGSMHVVDGEAVDLVFAEWDVDDDRPSYDSMLYIIQFLQSLLKNYCFAVRELLIQGNDGALYYDRQSSGTVFMHSILSLMKTDRMNYAEFAAKKYKFLESFFSQPDYMSLAKQFIDQYSCHALVRKREPQLYATLFPAAGILSFFHISRKHVSKTGTFSNRLYLRDVESNRTPIAQEVSETEALNITNNLTAIAVDTNVGNRGSINQFR